MATNNFFQNYDQGNEQQLHEDLWVEYIQIHGVETKYVSREVGPISKVFNEAAVSSYNTYYELEMYVVNYDGYQGQGAFLSKFGLEIRDQMTFAVARKRFREEVTQHDSERTRPREGDLIYFPLQKRIFQIKFVDDKHAFFQWGDLPVYNVSCELFEYSGESFTTGVPEIDRIQETTAINILDNSLLTEDNFAFQTEDGNYLVLEPQYDQSTFDPFDDGDDFQDESDFMDLSEGDPFSANGTY